MTGEYCRSNSFEGESSELGLGEVLLVYFCAPSEELKQVVGMCKKSSGGRNTNLGVIGMRTLVKAI